MEKTITLAAGCFWGAQAYFAALPGVLKTEVGYANGPTENPSYEQVCAASGHAEAVRILYNDQVVGLSFLLEKFYAVIDPVSRNRQGGDVGIQYRTGIYYSHPQDAALIEDSLHNLQRRHQRPIAVENAPLQNFYPAEDYHQNYLEKNPGGYCHISPAQIQAAKTAQDPARRFQKKSPEALKATLTPLQYEVTQNAATEPPFQNPYHNHFQDGLYVDVTTGEPLFHARDKFDSGCGWPAFSRPLNPTSLHEEVDFSHDMVRTEVKSRLGDAHLGHVFPDGPKEKGGLRYCINSAALRFIPQEDLEKEGYADFL